MKKRIIVITIISYFVVVLSQISFAAPKKNLNYYEVTVTDSIWDWFTTLGKPPEEKQKIKSEHKIHRAKRRKARAKAARKKSQDSLNAAREKEAQDLREERISQKRKRLQEKKAK